MAKEIHALLKFINVIFFMALVSLMMYYLNLQESYYGNVRGIYNPALQRIYEIVAALFMMTLLPFTAATFYKLKYNQLGFVGVTIINLFLLFAIYYMLY